MEEILDHQFCETVAITDYDDTNYESDFWGERDYENAIEQNVISKLVSNSVQNFLDCGGGFGRLIPAYYEKVKDKLVLFDYSQKLLDSAKQKYHDKENIQYVQGNLYKLPFADSYFDEGISVRVLHHVEDVPQFFKELNRVLKPGASFILEYANKRNTLEILRKLVLKSKLHPFSRKPENRSLKGLTINYHPKYLEDMLSNNGFVIDKKVASSLFRIPILKKILGHKRLASLENSIPFFLRKLAITPSVFLKIKKK